MRLGWRSTCHWSRLTAFEADFDSRTILFRMAHANGVASRLAIREFCTRSLLRENWETLSEHWSCATLKGANRNCDPGSIPALTNADILVELHDFIIPGISDEIRQRFTRTHRIMDISAQPRQLRDWPTSLISRRSTVEPPSRNIGRGGCAGFG
jgi:hypothetical protein